MCVCGDLITVTQKKKVKKRCTTPFGPYTPGRAGRGKDVRGAAVSGRAADPTEHPRRGHTPGRGVGRLFQDHGTRCVRRARCVPEPAVPCPLCCARLTRGPTARLAGRQRRVATGATTAWASRPSRCPCRPRPTRCRARLWRTAPGADHQPGTEAPCGARARDRHADCMRVGPLSRTRVAHAIIYTRWYVEHRTPARPVPPALPSGSAPSKKADQPPPVLSARLAADSKWLSSAVAGSGGRSERRWPLPGLQLRLRIKRFQVLDDLPRS